MGLTALRCCTVFMQSYIYKVLKLNTGVNGFDGDAEAQVVAGRGANLVKKAPKIVADETLALAA